MHTEANFPKQRKIVDYSISECRSSLPTDHNIFTRNINKFIEKNWQPYGNLNVDNNGWLYQAMVKYSEGE